MKKSKLNLMILSFLAISACGPVNNSPVDKTTDDILAEGIDIRSQSLREKGTSAQTIKTTIRNSKRAGKVVLGDTSSPFPNIKHYEDRIYKVSNDNFDLSCGIDDKTLTVAQRITQCEEQYAKVAYWDATTYGVSGEGSWQLVARDSENKWSLWYDRTTGFIWSDSVGKSTFDNSILSACDAFFDNKGVGNIGWMIPTRGDFLQADINGARYVLPSRELSYWSISQIDSLNIWSYNFDNAQSNKTQISSKETYIRCIGLPLN